MPIELSEFNLDTLWNKLDHKKTLISFFVNWSRQATNCHCSLESTKELCNRMENGFSFRLWSLKVTLMKSRTINTETFELTWFNHAWAPAPTKEPKALRHRPQNARTPFYPRPCADRWRCPRRRPPRRRSAPSSPSARRASPTPTSRNPSSPSSWPRAPSAPSTATWAASSWRPTRDTWSPSRLVWAVKVFGWKCGVQRIMCQCEVIQKQLGFLARKKEGRLHDFWSTCKEEKNPF